MYKYDPAGIVEDTEQTQFCPQMNRQMDRWTDGRMDGCETSSPPPPFNFIEVGGYKNAEMV